MRVADAASTIISVARDDAAPIHFMPVVHCKPGCWAMRMGRVWL